MTSKYDFSAFPTLETERLVLRQVDISDAEDVFALRGDYAVTKLNFGSSYRSVDDARRLIARMQDGFDTATHMRFGVTLRGENRVIGLIGFNNFAFADRRSSVGFDLQQAYWGRGIMPEALAAVLDFGFSRIQLNRIEADCSIMNLASQKVLRKAGFTYEGRQREQYFYDGIYYDLLLWGILRREWAGR